MEVIRQPVAVLALGKGANWAIAVAKDAPKLAIAVLSLTLIAAVFSPMVAPHDPNEITLVDRYKPPVWVDGGSAEYLLGTDALGRDIVSRLIYGARTSVSVGVLVVVVGGLIGTTLGLLAGYYGRWLDTAIMRAVDMTMAIPSVILALVFAATVGPSYWVAVPVLAFVVWPRFARLVRGEVLAVKQLDFVALARVAGASDAYIMVVHLLPSVRNSIVVLATLMVGWTILAEGTLSFLGAGIPPPTATWGGMAAEGRVTLATHWWISLSPGVAIWLVVLSANMAGDWLRDRLDPRLRQL
jgi:peptide/nickel transport system permease protein